MPGIHNRFYRSAAQEHFSEPLVADQSDLDSVAAEDLSGAASLHYGHMQGFPEPNEVASSFYSAQPRSADDPSVIYERPKRSVNGIPLRDNVPEAAYSKWEPLPDLNETDSTVYGKQKRSVDSEETTPIIYGEHKRPVSEESAAVHKASADNSSSGYFQEGQKYDSDLKGAGSSPYGLRGYVPVNQKRTAYKSPYASLARQMRYPVRKGRAEAEVGGAWFNGKGQKFGNRVRESKDRVRVFRDGQRQSNDGGREQAAATDNGDYGLHAGRHDDGSYEHHAHKYDDGSYQQHAVKYDDGSYDKYAGMYGEGQYGEPSGQYASEDAPVGRGEFEVSSRNTGEGLVSHY